MNNVTRIIVVVALMLAVAFAVVIKRRNSCCPFAVSDSNAVCGITDDDVAAIGISRIDKPDGLPRLVDLGADKCVPCKLMAPALKELEKEYAGVFTVIFIDVFKNPDIARKSGIRVIPTQIFYDASGKELYRHKGYYSKEGILAKWKELGVDLAPAGPDGADKKQE